MRTLFIVLFTFISLCGFSQTEKPAIYSGGMLIFQPGYTLNQNQHQEIRDLSFGIGGILRFYIGKSFTAGIYGGSQKTSYVSENSKSSYLHLGYGGPFVGFSKPYGNFRLTASAFVGGGRLKNLHVENQQGAVLEEAYFYEESTFVLSPVLSVDYSLTQRLLLSFQFVCLSAMYADNQVLYNPTFQLGILFNR